MNQTQTDLPNSDTGSGPRYKHVLALNPYTMDSMGSMGIFPPTGLEYVVTNMKPLVGKVTLVDLRTEKEYADFDKLCEFIRKDVDLICIAIMWRSRFEQVCKLISRLPPEVTTIVGGQTATEEVEYLFQRCSNIDMIVRGEGENIIQQIVSGTPLPEIDGLSYRQNGTAVHNKNGVLPEVAGLSFPDRSLRRYDYKWMENGVRLSDHTFDTILGARGCPYKCKFCTFNMNPLGQKREYTERPLESVVAELKSITADVVLFSDDHFFINPRRSGELCDLIIANGIKKTFIVQTRIEVTRHPDLLKKAFQAGVRILLVGIESPHDRILEQFDKGFTQKQVREAFAIFGTFDFYIHGYFIYGNVTETEEEMVYIGQFGREIGVDSIGFQKLRIEKFCPLQKLVESTPGYHYDRIGGPVYSDKYGLPELKKIRNRIRATFYTRSQIRRMYQKLHRHGLLGPKDILRVLSHLPVLAYNMRQRKIRKRNPELPAPLCASSPNPETGDK
jgi:anaerobic magnesium-protoporphyrin IX monomethyl ester cyclase